VQAIADTNAPVPNLVVRAGEICDLFTASDTDPLAQHEGKVMGEPALLRLARRLMTAREMGGRRKLVLLLRGDKITAVWRNARS